MQKGFTIIELIFTVLIVAGVGGWIGNIVRLAHMQLSLDVMPILRIIGIFVAPLGSVLGFIPN